jgi:hypothetical protein
VRDDFLDPMLADAIPVAAVEVEAIRVDRASQLGVVQGDVVLIVLHFRPPGVDGDLDDFRYLVAWRQIVLQVGAGAGEAEEQGGEGGEETHFGRLVVLLIDTGEVLIL